MTISLERRMEQAGRRADRLYLAIAVWLLLGAAAFVGSGPPEVAVLAALGLLGGLVAWATVSERGGWRGLSVGNAWDAAVSVTAIAAVAVAAVVVAGSGATPTAIGRVLDEPGQHVGALIHWSLAAAALPLVLLATVVVGAKRGRGSASAALASAGSALYLVEMVTGTAIEPSAISWVSASHLWIGGASWACLAGATTAAIVWPGVARPESGGPTGAALVAVSWRARAGAYVALTKPRIIELLLVTTVPAMLLAARDVAVPPSTLLWLIACTLVGGTLAAGSANAINCYLDRDIDNLMLRTQRRPLPAQTIAPDRALTFGLGLGVLAFVLLVVFVNLLAAVLTLLAIAFYVVVYTVVLKRSTPQNIVIGGAAGALPPVIGWAAVRGDVGATALLLFLIVFYWTPPHFWALSVRLLRDYAAAGVPMLPVVRGIPETNRQILLYSILLVLLTVALIPIGSMGVIYLIGAAAIGAWFLAEVWGVWRDGSGAGAIRLYRHSITYLGALFGFIALDAVLTVHF